MAIESVLARQYVEFAVRGLGAVRTAMGAVHTGLRRVDTATKAFKERIDRLTPAAAKLAALSGAFVGFFGRAALKDTEEGQALNKTFEDLSKTIGEIFVPYARRLTEVLDLARTGFANLSPETKDAVAKFTLLAAGLSTLAYVSLPAFANALKVVSTAAVLATSKIGLLTLAITGLGIVLTEVIGKGETFGERFDDAFRKVKTFFTTGGLGNVITDFTKVPRAAKTFGRTIDDILKSMNELQEGFSERGLSGLLGKLGEGLTGLGQGLRNLLPANLQASIGQLLDLLNKPLNREPPKPKKSEPKFGFETAEQQMQRLQLALMGVEDEQIKLAKEQLEVEKAELEEMRKIYQLWEKGIERQGGMILRLPVVGP